MKGSPDAPHAFFANIIDNLIADGLLPPIIGVFVPSIERNPEYIGMTTPEYISAFSDELTQYGIAHRYREVHDGHDWTSWRERTPEILRFFFSR